jgi:hypothetical protein
VVRRRAAAAVDALGDSLQDASLRRLIVAWLTTHAGRAGLLVVALGIAYERGGPVAVGALGVVRYLTPAVIAPFSSVPTARWPTEVVLRGANAVRLAAVVGAVLVVVAGGPLPLLGLAVALEAAAVTRPLHMALLPAVSSTPQQLVAANVSSSACEGLGTFIGPALAGLSLGTLGPVAALLIMAMLDALGVAALWGLRVPTVGRRRRPITVHVAMAELVSGARAVASIPGPRIVAIGFGLQTFVRGLLTVLIVVASIESLGLGQPGIGSLNAAMGLGALAGAVLAMRLAGPRRLGPAFILSLAGWGAPIALIGLVAWAPIAFLAMAAVGISNAVIDVAGYTLIQRTTPNDRRVAVLGMVDGTNSLGPAIGGAIAPLLIGVAGVSGALIVSGLILPIVAGALVASVRRLDEGGPAAIRRVELLGRQPLFRPLSLATQEHLAATMVPVSFNAGDRLIREGAEGDRYLLIDAGDVEVLQGDRVVGTRTAGDGIGEVALLEAVPRTASVRAVGPVSAFALDRAAFLDAVTGHAASHAAARGTAAAHRSADAGRVG